MDKSYLMGDIAEELNISKTKVFRCIKELEIEAINEKTREHSNSPKKYSEKSKELIVANLTKAEDRNELQNKALQNHYRALQSVTVTQEHRDNNDKECKKEERYKTLQERCSNDSERIIKLLEDQLEFKDKELDRAYQEKQDLIRLLDQQQRLSLQANQKIETLELKIKEVNKVEEILEEKDIIYKEKKSKWYDIFKRKN